jgi:DNA polymerase III delta prime subunit
MHAFLIVSSSREFIKTNIESLSKKHKLKTIEFVFEKIKDSRNLSSFVKLSQSKKVGIIIKNIDNASVESLNAFLKNLEEPQENIIYILTTNSIHTVLPTITSRCQIIYDNMSVKSTNQEEDKRLAQDFVTMNNSQKLLYLDSIKKREDALDFIKKFILGSHSILHSNQGNYRKITKYIKSANTTYRNLKANGNVNLQLTNFFINLD